MSEIKETINKNEMEDYNPVESNNETTNFYKIMFKLLNQPKTEAELEYKKILGKFVGMCMKERLELSALQHQIDLKNKTVELKVYNLFEKIINVMDRNIPDNKEDDKRFINLMEKVVDILHTNKNKQIDNKEKCI